MRKQDVERRRLGSVVVGIQAEDDIYYWPDLVAAKVHDTDINYVYLEVPELNSDSLFYRTHYTVEAVHKPGTGLLLLGGAQCAADVDAELMALYRVREKLSSVLARLDERWNEVPVTVAVMLFGEFEAPEAIDRRHIIGHDQLPNLAAVLGEKLDQDPWPSSEVEEFWSALLKACSTSGPEYLLDEPMPMLPVNLIPEAVAI